jgi:hypothetical protein
MATQEPIDAHTGLRYHEYYLYSEKAWELAPSGASEYQLSQQPLQNAPVVVTPTGMQITSPMDTWSKVSGPEKYEKVGYGYFTLLPDGSYDRSVKQFSIFPDSSGAMLFNGPLKEDVYIEYEAGANGYHLLDSIDYNPIRNEVDSGFLHFSKVTDPAHISVMPSRTQVKADGIQGVKLTATVYDEDYDRVPSKNVVFEVENLVSYGTSPSGAVPPWSALGGLLPTTGQCLTVDASGQCVRVLELSESRGEAYVNWKSNIGQAGTPIIKAYYQEASGVFAEAGFLQYYIKSDPFVLDVSQLDTYDYLT